MRSAPAVENSIGTGFGDKSSHEVRSVPFTQESNKPNEELAINYDSRQGLRKRGVDLDQRPKVGEPNPFPGNRGCQPPDGWTG
jgi:hypothetical protein